MCPITVGISKGSHGLTKAQSIVCSGLRNNRAFQVNSHYWACGLCMNIQVMPREWSRCSSDRGVPTSKSIFQYIKKRELWVVVHSWNLCSPWKVALLDLKIIFGYFVCTWYLKVHIRFTVVWFFFSIMTKTCNMRVGFNCLRFLLNTTESGMCYSFTLSELESILYCPSSTWIPGWFFSSFLLHFSWLMLAAWIDVLASQDEYIFNDYHWLIIVINQWLHLTFQ